MTGKFARTYHGNSAPFVLYAALGILVIVLGVVSVRMGGHELRDVPVSYRILATVAILIADCYALYANLPFTLTLDPQTERYDYVWGFGPLIRRTSGTYEEIDSVYVKQYTTLALKFWSGGYSWGQSIWGRATTEEELTTSTTHDVRVRWKSGMEAAVAARKDIMVAQRIAEELAMDTNILYNGTYDSYNQMWIEGPLHKHLVGVDERMLAAQLDERFPDAKPDPEDEEAPGGAQPTPDLPPALGDDAGMNHSDMWK